MLIYDRRAAAIVLVGRRFAPLGWALPGGFVEYGETVEAAARREALEETSLRVQIKGLLGVYSDPARDARGHAISTVFWGKADNPEQIQGGDDAGEARFFALNALPAPIVFDHARIIDEFVALIVRLG
jgi:8-oxo-dGTP diphosphatase